MEVDLQKNLLQKEAEKNVSLINNDITKAEQENLANVEAYKKVFIYLKLGVQSHTSNHKAWFR